ncbi:hypothetical protein BX661DRAFT_176126 [Kickxella alabastrina]|uniref:uncharacterized protein n=1 Tax=Kickxella alabastrina TaxID=61397 RepID=UPI00221EA95F|nr:uncharacterized protein BX661DRAFT_176126 [Kickxella alabastrina]KAI7835126.1 hypothetical protein BX661DRAFT_176126 [Kickxella alabastrina]KAJ1947528.1 hypothetical protein GGF37_000293 [Kickxella alabastrina]
MATNNLPSRQGELAPAETSSLYRRPTTRINFGSTLQSSVVRGFRRRSTTTMGDISSMLGPDNIQRRRTSMLSRGPQQDSGESINYDVGDLFDYTDGPAPVISRVNSETLAGARLTALTAQRANADGELQPPPTQRQMIGMYLDASAAGRRWDQLDALLNTAVVALHVYNTTHISQHRLSVPYWSLATEAIISGIFLLQFLPRYMLAPDPLEYFRSQFSIITLISALTPLAVVAHISVDPLIYDTFMSAGPWVFLYPVIFWRLQPALLRCLVPIKNVYRMTPMTRNVLRALTTVFTTVLAITVLTHIMVYYQNKDKGGEIQGFDEALFFIAVSSITGLSSDIEPDTWFTRSIVLFVMFIGIFWLPPRVSEMLSLWQDRSPWPAHFEAEFNQSHVLVIGDLEYTMLFEFLREFFCEDHGLRTVNTVVVVMSERSPGKEVAELLSDPAYVNRVKFVLGSPTSFKQLAKVEAQAAQAIFLLSSKAGADAAKEDAAKVMIALAVRKYLKGHGNSRHPVPIYAQVLLPETTLHLEYLADHVICVEELRLGLLAKSVMVPGFASLLQLLTSSIPNNTTDPLVRVARNSRQPWLAEYAQGMAHEIYATRISSIFNGVRFQRAAQVIFQRTGATLFALRVPDRRVEAGPEDGRILINPAGYMFIGDELGFVITSNSLVSMDIAYLTEQASVDMGDVMSDDEETTPLIPGLAITDAAAAAAVSAEDAGIGSPLQRKLAVPEMQRTFLSPFGGNVMDTLAVSDALPQHMDDDDHDQMSISSAVSKALSAKPSNEESSDLIDLSDHGILSPELAVIMVDDDLANGSDSEHSDSAMAPAPKVQMKRTPLVFDPRQQKASEVDLTKLAAATSSAEVTPKTAAGSVLPASKPQGAEAPKPAPVGMTSDGLPGDISGHIIVCDTSSEFPSNIIYLVSCIRAAAPSEVTVIAEAETQTHAAPAATTAAPARKSNPFASLYEQISRSYNEQPAAAAQQQQPTQEQAGERKGSFLNMQPIVILSPGEPTDLQREDLSRFGCLHIVHGSPLSRTDLARVRIHTASSSIVLANREESLNAAADSSNKLSLAGSDTSATATADAPALLSVLNIEALTYNSPDFFLSVEFIHRENMQFVGDSETMVVNEVYGQAFLRPSFMSGRVYAPVMLDTLICQSYYNKHILEIMKRLIFSHGNVVHALGMAKMEEAGIDGAMMLEDEDEESSGHVFLVEVPERFYGRSYSSLFSHCCFKHSAVPMGLYRMAIHHRQPLWYVVPNPAVDSVMREGDRVYMIAATRPVLE